MTTTIERRPGTSRLFRREIIEKYPDVSPFVIIKTDIQRRSVAYTERALATLDVQKHQVNLTPLFARNDEASSTLFPFSLLLRDGTSVITSPDALAEDPYVVDYLDDRTVLVDDGEIVDEVEFWPRHDFFNKLTSSGRPMWHFAFFRPQRLDFCAYGHCHFWDNGKGCKYCNIGAIVQKARKAGISVSRVSPADIQEAAQEGLKYAGRYTSICLSGGSIPGDDHSFEQEVQVYIETLQAIGANFSTRRFPSQLIASAFSERQLARLYEETGLLSYTADIEVLDEEKFNWMCPGKAASVGYQQWRRRLVAAVGIFGAGRVSTNIVGGVELATPHGFASEEEALRVTLEGAEELASQGVVTVAMVWYPCAGSAFFKQKTPSLEYHVRLAKGLDDLRRQYDLNVDMDNYRRCGNHPSSDLARI